MKDLAIYGAGGFGREVACLIRLINEKEPTWNLIGFFDDGREIGYETEYGIVLGGRDKLNEYSKDLALVLAIGNPQIISSIVSDISNPFVYFPNIYSPDLIFLDRKNVRIGKGNIFCSGCLVSCNVEIHDFNVFNGYITIGHDATIGNFNSFMPAVRISGEVYIGNRNFFGVGSIVLQKITIGDDTTVGANSLVIRKTKNGETYVGSPAKIIKY